LESIVLTSGVGSASVTAVSSRSSSCSTPTVRRRRLIVASDGSGQSRRSPGQFCSSHAQVTGRSLITDQR
jgi:hypothetical protein